MMPKVSICIPAYNQPELIRRVLQSIAVQSYKDFEVVITDDSTNDGVELVVNEFSLMFRLRYMKNNTRKGSPGNWNECIRQACGEYIKLLHHDDWLQDENSLEKFVALLEGSPKADFAFCASQIYQEGTKLYSRSVPWEGHIRQLKKDPRVLCLGNFIGNPSVTIFRRKTALEFDPLLVWVVDIDFYIRLLSGNRQFSFTSDPLVCVTMGSNHQVTAQCWGNKKVELFEWLYLYQKVYQGRWSGFHQSIFIIKLLLNHEVKSRQDLFNVGVFFDIPNYLLLILPFMRFLRAVKRVFIGHNRNQLQ